tara:strand:+ start:10151 stop:11023 length:873 start_codon:yes stop_codon:yes gene_type:complete
MSFNDYGERVRNNARRGIELNEKEGNKCGTLVGKQRAQQLAAGQNVSIDTVKRMYSYLSRARVYYDANNTTECGTISYLLWGGPAALAWSRNKLRELGEIELEKDQVLIDGRIAYKDKATAERVAREMGCKGSHEHTKDGVTYHMPCATHDRYAEIGPKGGVKGSPKAPKSDTPNPNPKRGGAGDASSERTAKVPKDVDKILQKKSDDFNERYKEKLGYGVSVSKLRAVYKRGVGAFQTSHSPAVKSERQWALARVNAFLYLVKNGRPENKKYTQDNDILPKGHPKSDKA